MLEIGTRVRYSLERGEFTIAGYVYYCKVLWYIGITDDGMEKDLRSICVTVIGEPL